MTLMENDISRWASSTGISSKVQLQAKTIAKRYERLLLMQLDVPMGHMPRTIQQLVAPGASGLRGENLK